MASSRSCFLALVAATCCALLLFSLVKDYAFVREFGQNNSVNGFNGQNQSEKLLTKNNSAPEMQISKTVILVYSTFFSDENWVRMDERCIWYEPEERQCPLDIFEITLNRNRFAESNLVIFHAVKMPGLAELKSLLKRRPSSQRWVYSSWESPMLTPNPSPLNGLFNLTWTYRTDSDIGAPYGSFEPLSDSVEKISRRMKWRPKQIIVKKNQNLSLGWLVTVDLNCEYLLSANWKSSSKLTCLDVAPVYSASHQTPVPGIRLVNVSESISSICRLKMRYARITSLKSTGTSFVSIIV